MEPMGRLLFSAFRIVILKAEGHLAGRRILGATAGALAAGLAICKSKS